MEQHDSATFAEHMKQLGAAIRELRDIDPERANTYVRQAVVAVQEYARAVGRLWEGR